jgi:hypothetical protein
MDGGTWKTVAEGSTGGRGDQKNFPPVTAQLFRLNITKAKWQPGISEWELFQE